jgi:hypothetical protein
MERNNMSFCKYKVSEEMKTANLDDYLHWKSHGQLYLD